jgi:hypothetical protein
MYGTSYEIYKEIDPQKKNAIWADQCITILRRDWVPLVNQTRCRDNKRYLDSMQSMDHIKDKFKDAEFKKELEFDPIGIMEAFKNTLIEEILKTPPKAELKATDPSAMSDRRKDIELLKNRKIVEGDINQYQKQVYSKLPKYKFDSSKFKGNVSEFEKMNLDENDPEDLTFYEQELQRLNYEIAGQSVINNVLKNSRFDQDTVMKIARDILAVKALCLQTYVDKITGEIKAWYRYPETFYGIFGDAGDGRNDICNGWNDNISINEWLQLVGNEFDWARDWRKLLWAINYCGNTKYTGFIRNNTRYDCCGNKEWMNEGGITGQQTNLLDWTMAFNYQINCGYVEWKTEEATKTFLLKKTNSSYVDVVPYSYELDDKKNLDGYYKESNYQQQTYGSYFISTSSVSQWIFGFGKVYYQTLHGSNDEYSSGTLKYYFLPGKSAVEIAKPYIKMANNAFYKMLWAIEKAKPEDDVYIYEELVQIAKGLQRLYPQSGAGGAPKLDSIIRDAIKYQRENVVRIRAYPQVEGRPVLQLPPLEGKKNGLDPVYIAMQAVLTWAEGQVGIKIGINPMRTGMNPPSRESEKSEMNTVAASINATSYIYRMIQYTKERLATDVLNITQDIIKYKDSVPYNWLRRLIGEESFSALFLLDEYASHRYGLFVKDYNSDFQKQRINQAADMALGQKQIEIDQWAMITQSEDYKMATKLLSLYKRKKEKRERQQALQDMKVQQQMQEAKHKQELELIQVKGKIDIQKASIEANGLIESAKIQSEGRIKVKEITVDAEPEKQSQKAEATKEVNSSKEKDQESKPFPAVARGQ